MAEIQIPHDLMDEEEVIGLKKLVAYHSELLQEEQSSTMPDLFMVGYLKREIAKYKRIINGWEAQVYVDVPF